MKHQKHIKLARPAIGNYGRFELAIMGAPCDDIKALVGKICGALAEDYKIAFLDADHHAPEANEFSSLNFGASTQVTNKISHYSIDQKGDDNIFLNGEDLVLINGNHFSASEQILWLHPKKSLEKKLDKISNVSLIITEGKENLPEYLIKHLEGQLYRVVSSIEIEKITTFVKNRIQSKVPPINGLVLVGGKSSRMNQDKSQLVIHSEQPQYQYLSNLLKPYCDNVFVSVRDDAQGAEYPLPAITDKFVGLGPYGGILSAFQYNPNAAWLVLAVDLPFLDEATLQQLISRRNISKTATCFIDRNNEFPEPLITIWEPRAYPVLLNFLAKGYSCPRKALINSDVELIEERDKKALTNVNYPEDLELAISQLSGNGS